MKIGISGGGASFDRAAEQAVEAENDGFSSLWYPSNSLGDPFVAMTVIGRATTTIELGTAVVMTYGCHPTLMANRAAAVAAAIGRPITLGIGPSHAAAVEHVIGGSYATAGRHTEEYVSCLAALLRGDAVDHVGAEMTVRATGPKDANVSLVVAALAPRMLRVAGEHAAGTITWMANARAIATHVVPRIGASASSAGKLSPRVICGVPIAVHDDVAEAREAAAAQWKVYGTLPNYQRILAIGGISSPAEAVIVGNEAAVRQQVRALADAGVTDLWCAPFPVGTDRSASRQRTRSLLCELAASS